MAPCPVARRRPLTARDEPRLSLGSAVGCSPSMFLDLGPASVRNHRSSPSRNGAQSWICGGGHHPSMPPAAPPPTNSRPATTSTSGRQSVIPCAPITTQRAPGAGCRRNNHSRVGPSAESSITHPRTPCSASKLWGGCLPFTRTPSTLGDVGLNVELKRSSRIRQESFELLG